MVPVTLIPSDDLATGDGREITRHFGDYTTAIDGRLFPEQHKEQSALFVWPRIDGALIRQPRF